MNDVNLKKLAAACLLALMAWPLELDARMTSTNYEIYADSVNTGGVYSTGGDYVLQDTAGESPAGITSNTYEVRAGYQAMDYCTISFSLSTSTVNLGTLSVSQVSSASVSATVGVDCVDGYTLSVSGVSGTSVAAVSDGAVTAGAAEYGVAVSGADASFANDRAVASGLTLASHSADISSSATTLTFKASVSSASLASTATSYSQTVTLTAAAGS